MVTSTTARTQAREQILQLCWAGADARTLRLEFLRGIAGPLTTALRHSQAAAFAAGRGGEQAGAGPVVLLLSPALEVRAQTPQTQRYLRLLIPPNAAAQAPVPAGAYNVGAQLLAREAGVDGNPPLARVHLGSGHWLIYPRPPRRRSTNHGHSRRRLSTRRPRGIRRRP